MATINCLLHPHHVSLGKKYTSLHMLHQRIDDPYYSLDGRPSHEGVAVPRFDVREGSDAFYLDGDLPGLTHLSDIFCEFIDNQVLIVRGVIKPKLLPTTAVEPKGDPFIPTLHPKSDKFPDAEVSGAEPETTWKLKERQVGKFERSFTFPSIIKQNGMKTSLEAGVLSIVLPKDHEADAKVAAKMEIESEFS
ncbi:hypothetical protein EG329_005855 [Mollisiaceae sp. DMI_Dod_QoI]|nr:hypothetical protein EG329_005855 [Helotiales sp. DMI_Dod_QoI]